MSYTETQWIAIIAPLAVAEFRRQEAIQSGRGYLPSVLIAQTCVETGYGNDSIYVPYHNILGMKASLLNGTWDSVWSGECVTGDTIEEYTTGNITHITDSFRVYSSFEQCLHDYVQFMNGQKYAGTCSIRDPETLIRHVSQMGYATASTYVDSVMKIIRKHDLTRYDKEVKPNMLGDFIKWVNGWTRYNFTRRDRVPTHICLHYTANPFSTAEQNANYYNTCQTAHASADFFVDEVEVIGLNQDIPHFYSWATGKKWFDGVHGAELWNIATIDKTISIEMCCKTKSGRRSGLAPNDPDWYFEPKTIENTKKLVIYLMAMYNIPASNITTHYHICGKTCPGILGWNTNGTNENEFLAFVNDCANGVVTSEDTIKEIQKRFISIGFDMGCKDGEPDGDWGKGSKSDCLDFCTLYGIVPSNQPNDAVLAKLSEVEQINDSVVFDADYYAAKNKDLAKAGLKTKAQLLAHFFVNGIKEGNRKSAPTFSIAYYRKKYKDLAELDNFALVLHFVKNGMGEGRRASSDFNLYKYYGNYEDLREAFGELYTDGKIDAAKVKKNAEKYYRHFATLGYNEKRVANKAI